jgi:hypothetical protein
MSKRLEEGVWVVICDWSDPETGDICNLGYDGSPTMFVDPDGGKTPEMHFQCGKHHNVVKQSERAEYQLPAGHKLDESTIQPQGLNRAEDIGVTLDGFKPDASGRVWEGNAVNTKENSDD